MRREPRQTANAGSSTGASLLKKWLALEADEVFRDEPDIGGTFGKTPHVPREPVLAVRDQDAQRAAGGDEAENVNVPSVLRAW